MALSKAQQGGKPKRVFYDCDKFPFERLRLGTLEKGRIVGKEWTHWYTYLVNEADPTRLEDYGVKFPRQTGGAITYYLSKEGKPSLYLRQDVHSDWSKPGPDGKVSRQKSIYGTQVETFWNRWYDRLIELLEAVPMAERIKAMGAKVAKKPLRDAIDHPLHWQTYPDDHARGGEENEEKSQQIKLTVWSKDLSRVDNDGESGGGGNAKKWQQKKQQLDLARSQVKENAGAAVEDTEGASEIIVPGTDLMLLTNLYDLTSDDATGDLATRYEQWRRFIACRVPHPNASPRYCRLTTKAEVIAPLLTFKRSDDGDGEIKIKPKNLYVLTCSTGSYNTTLQSDKLAELKREREEERLAQGITDENDESADPSKRHKANDGSHSNQQNGAGEGMQSPEEDEERARFERDLIEAQSQLPGPPKWGK